MTGRGIRGRRTTRRVTLQPAKTGRSMRAPAYLADEGRVFRRIVLAALIGFGIAPLATACGNGGFRPMYAANLDGQSLSDAMAQVSVTTIPGRVGQRVRNELIFQTTGGGGAAQEKAYKLDIVLRERLTSQLVDAQGDAESQIYHIDADFQLTERASGAVILKGQSFGRAGFQRFQTIYANVRAKRDAENRAARTIAGDVRSRIEAALSRRQQL
jgi:LPS-assembly lipoprotein